MLHFTKTKMLSKYLLFLLEQRTQTYSLPLLKEQASKDCLQRVSFFFFLQISCNCKEYRPAQVFSSNGTGVFKVHLDWN